MRNMSLRKFRTEVGSLTEPVEVSVRSVGGNIRVLGFWTPYATPDVETRPTLDIPVDEEFPVAEESEFDRHPRTAPKIVHSPEEAAALVPFNPVRAVLKPSQKKRR